MRSDRIEEELSYLHMSVEPVAPGNTRLIDRAVCLWEAIEAITERGNNAEVKRKKDGSFTVYEVKKNIVTV